jgi:hypothetical protein
VLGDPGSDLSTVLGLDFHEAVTGAAASVTLDVMGPCTDCKVRQPVLQYVLAVQHYSSTAVYIAAPCRCGGSAAR